MITNKVLEKIENYCADMLQQQRETASDVLRQAKYNNYMDKASAINGELMAFEWDELDLTELGYIGTPFLYYSDDVNLSKSSLDISLYKANKDGNVLSDDITLELNYKGLESMAKIEKQLKRLLAERQKKLSKK